MKNVILIISHKRPKCSTAKAILDAGYTGEWYIVADDLDDTDYEGLFPAHVKRFNKRQYVEATDTCDNFKKLTAAVYARNACRDIALSMGADTYTMLDDDLHGFVYRYVKDGKLLSKKVTCLDLVLESYCSYIVEAGIACGGFVASGRLIGGADNQLVAERFYYAPTSAFIINNYVHSFPFIGYVFEDAIYCYRNNMVGNLCCAFMPITILMDSPLSCKEGGCTEIDKSQDIFVTENYINMTIPSFFKWRIGAKSEYSKNLPRILNEKWRNGNA